MPASIFVVDSSPAVRRMVEQISSPQGYEVLGFQSGPAALEAARRMTPVLIIADYHLADMTFSGFCKEVSRLDHLTETILVSVVASSDRLDEEHLRSLGVRAFLKKPLQADELTDTIKDLKNGGLQSSATARTLKKRAWPPDSTATDLADWLVRSLGLPFRRAHHVTGRLVSLAADRKVALVDLPLPQMQTVESRITRDVFKVLTVEASVNARRSYGGTAPANVRAAIVRTRKRFL